MTRDERRDYYERVWWRDVASSTQRKQDLGLGDAWRKALIDPAVEDAPLAGTWTIGATLPVAWSTGLADVQSMLSLGAYEAAWKCHSTVDSIRVQATISPMLPGNPTRFADLLVDVADRVIVDAFASGDGSGGTRT